MDEPVRFVRRPFFVMAFLITKDNMDKVAEWCDGEILKSDSGVHRFIKVTKVLNPQNERQTKAYIGDYVLKSGEHFKVYTTASFNRSFKTIS